MLEILKIIYGVLLVLFLPGFIMTFIFFSYKKIDLIERIAMSFALSISVVPLVVFYMNLLGIPVNSFTVSLQILMVISLMLLYLGTRYLIDKNDKK